jgi:type IX secretion system PorP/SprF family membrane protein
MRKLLLSIAIASTSIAFGQQLPQYSQYNRNQFMINPGAAGMYDFMDFTVGGRYQWAGFDNAPVTAYAYGSTVLKNNKQKYNPSTRTSRGSIMNPVVNTGRLKHAIGGQIVADQYGAFRKISFAGTYAIHLPVSKTHNLSFGTKLGISNNSFLQDRATVLSNMDGFSGTFENDQTYNDFVADQGSMNFLDIGAGFYFYSKDLFVGVSADNLTKDMVSFGSGSANFDPRMHFNITAGYKFPLNDNLTLMPSVLAKVVPNAPLSVEGTVQLEYKEWLWFGASYRHGDAAVIMLGGSISEKFKFGYSFDFSLTKFNKHTSGGHEIVLGIMIGR